MGGLFLAIFSLIGVVSVFGVEPTSNGWLTSYADAYHRAGVEGKPVLVVFSSRAESVEKLAELANRPGLENDFIPVFASKLTPAGQKIFSTFNIKGPEACVVVDRTLRWQYCRYERALNRSEFDYLLANARLASGIPQVDILATRTQTYYPPATHQPSTPVNWGTPQIGYGTTSYGGWSMGAGMNCLS
jgi:hypothetical protein